ncbi:NYN domain-containing protein [Gabonibacter chumensis]|uniref:NYN domain-containing protein n=1 Tax=Gabonibacter chumensis TaxID=2972474 RepID=UPI0025745D62|nr:NYN domain-containing protein [Gabonibacter chumensis]MCR9012121.1 NYN domain-containing protein [Gabonibacter chumensis]
MKNQRFNIAVLIDGDNAQAKLIKEVLQEVSKYGKATIRRIYGDWTQAQMNSWKDIVNEYSINPVQKFSYTTGKNSTDSSLIIDAMDILHAKNCDGFCIVSSDSDYTGLAKRIREEGLFVMGIGERKTPVAFVQSCEIFTFCENLIKEEVKMAEAEQKPKATKRNTPKSSVQEEPPVKERNTRESLPRDIIDKAFEISTNEDEEAYIANVGMNLRKIDPSFDPRTYGFSNLTKLMESIKKYKVIKNIVNGLNHPLVRLKDNSK